MQNPPPISGGTLLITADGRTAVAADPDRDRLWIVDLQTLTLSGQVLLQPGDEPGRLIEGGAGRIHVALRRGGALVSFDLTTPKQVLRRSVCAAPRGVAYDPAGAGSVHVACASGELVTLPAASGAITRSVQVQDDLRDVIVQGDKLYVSTFRSAQLYTLDASGARVAQTAPPAFTPSGGYGGGITPPSWPCGVAWRTIGLPGGGVAMLHQRSLGSGAEIDLGAGGFGRHVLCDTSGLVHSSLSFLVAPPDPFTAAAIGTATLPTDVAVSRDRTLVAIAAPGNGPGRSQVMLAGWNSYVVGAACINANQYALNLDGGITSVAFDPDNRLIAQGRQPAALYFFPAGQKVVQIPLPGADAADPGHALFHDMAGAYLACASCHPEGGDDNRVWNLKGVGLRRTQSLLGGLLATAPFHWNGDMTDLYVLMSTVFTSRMGGPVLAPAQVDTLGRWLDAQPTRPLAPAADALAVSRGQQLFNDARTACATCHSGPALTNNLNVDVGTGGSFQTPALRGLAARAPYMHDGCAATLRDTLRSARPACSGARHGDTSQLSEAQLTDLLAYLQTR